jgi:Leucine-rich repeat (LRR) protein
MEIRKETRFDEQVCKTGNLIDFHRLSLQFHFYSCILRTTIQIKTLQNTTFSRLPNLRKIYLSQNVIHYIEPRTFLIEPGSLLHVDVSKNKRKKETVTVPAVVPNVNSIV